MHYVLCIIGRSEGTRTLECGVIATSVACAARRSCTVADMYHEVISV